MVAAVLLLLVVLPTSADTDVRAFGARGDGVAKDTTAIQATVDAASKAGGGVVRFPAGRYLSGTVHLRSHVTIQLDPGAVLAASLDNADFDPYEKLSYDSHADQETTDFAYALLAGRDLENVAIIGQGVIDGNRPKRHGPKPVALKLCRRITIRDIRLENAPNYNLSFLGCEQIVIDGVTIRNGYADGIDSDCCRDVRISNCSIESSDDALCLKASLALGERRACENVTITNCVLSSRSNNFKMGTESSGDFRTITLSNCVMYRGSGEKDNSGIAIESVDGSNIDGVSVSNVVMREVHNPIFIRLGNRGRGMTPPVPGTLQNVSISGIIATGADMTCSITGIPNAYVKHVNVSNVRITTKSPPANNPGLAVPEVESKYPECNMFGALPAYAFYIRHGIDVILSDIRAEPLGGESRSAVVMDDVRSAEIRNSDCAVTDGPVFWLNNVRDSRIAGFHTAVGGGLFLRVTGPDSRDIEVSSCALADFLKQLALGLEVRRKAVRLIGNPPYQPRLGER